MRYVPTILTVTAVLALATAAWGQALPPGMTFSVDLQGPTATAPGPFTGFPDGFGSGIVIDEGSILTPAPPGPPGPNPPSPGPLPPPGIMVTAAASGGGTVPGGLGIVGGVFGGVELDALSYGRDIGEVFLFSVDEFSVGIAGIPLPPNVFTEGPLGGPAEASADVFRYLGGPVPVLAPPPPIPVFGNRAIVDGDGMPPSGMPGVGLIEPNPPTLGVTPDPGDNLDAVDMNTTMNDVMGPIYFSLDSTFPDPLEVAGWTVNSGTAVGNGFAGGDVLVSFAGGAPVVYAAAPLLGLDIAAGAADSDDLDALALLENGDGIFTPGVDQIYFSVRRGSAVIGLPDSMWGAPIEESDILTIPVAGGASPFPAIVIPGEAMGLWTMRSFGISPHPIHNMPFGDDLDALDMIPEPATMTLLALGACMALGRRKRR